MMTYQMEHFIVRKTVSVSTIKNNGSGMLLQNVTCIFGEKNSWTIRELIYGWQKKDTKDLKVINDLICIETLCNWKEFNISLPF